MNVHGIMNTSGLLQETRSIHDSKNIPKLNLLLIFTYNNKYLNIEIIYNLGKKQFCIWYVIVLTVCWTVKRKSGTASVNTDSQCSKQETCFALATQVWLAVNHNTSVTSGEWIWCSKRNARASELGSCQLNICHSWGYERFQKSKDSLKACFENVNILSKPDGRQRVTSKTYLFV